MQQAKSEKEEHTRLRKIASSIAKEVKHFWDSMRKVYLCVDCCLQAPWYVRLMEESTQFHYFDLVDSHKSDFLNQCCAVHVCVEAHVSFAAAYEIC